MHYYGTRLSENLSMRESASSIYATPHCGDRLFRLVAQGCRPFFTENEHTGSFFRALRTPP